MKILHFADTHLGMENYGRLDPKTGLNSRLFDFLKSFDYLVSFAQKNKPDLVLFAGDAYRSREPSQTYQREFAIRIKKLSELCPVVLILGNHDSPVVSGKATTLDIFSALASPNVFISRHPEIFKIPLKSEGKSIQIATLPWLPKSYFSHRREEDLPEEIAKNLSQKVSSLAKKIKKIEPSILLGHLTVSGALFSSEQSVMLGQDIVLPLSVFKNSPFNYIGLGHLHRHQTLSEKPPIIYPGSIERIDFAEEKEEKGFIWLEITGKKVFWKFIPLPARKFLTIRVELGSNQDPTSRVLEEIKNYQLKEGIIRLILSGKRNLLALLDFEKIRKCLEEAYYFALIKEIEEEARPKISQFTEELSPLEALEHFLVSKKIPQKRIKILKKEAQKLIKDLSS